MTNEYIEVPINVEVSGYLVDWEYGSGTYDMVRTDMNADVDIPLKVDVDV